MIPASIRTTNTQLLPNHQLHPMIQKWEAATGKLLSTYPFQIPEDDKGLIEEYSKRVQFLCWPTNQIGPSSLVHSLLNFEEANNSNIIRLYRLNDGTCVGDTYVSRKLGHNSSSYLMQNPEDGHHLMLITQHSNNGQASVTDMASGKKIHTFKIPSQHFFKAMVSPGGQYLVFIFMNPTNGQKYLEVYRNLTWEPLGNSRFQQGLSNNSPSWMIPIGL